MRFTQQHKRIVLISVIGCLLAIAASGAYYVQRTLTFPPLPSYDASVLSGKPEGASCLNTLRSPSLAIELIDLAADQVYLAGGANPISEAQWDQTRVMFPHLKNSKRYLLFEDSCFYRSPAKSADCQGQDCVTYGEHYGHTWLVLNDLAGQACYPDGKGCHLDRVKPGYVSITTIDKCQEITFSGPTIYELADQRGNRYIMHATSNHQPDITTVALPAGWQLSQVEISQPLILQPRGQDHCYYNIIRDEKLQSYHQYVFVDEVSPPLPPLEPED